MAKAQRVFQVSTADKFVPGDEVLVLDRMKPGFISEVFEHGYQIRMEDMTDSTVLVFREMTGLAKLHGVSNAGA